MDILIHAENDIGVTLSDQFSELIDLVVTPQHRNGVEAEGLGGAWVGRAPGVESDGELSEKHQARKLGNDALRSLIGLVVLERVIVAVGPRETDFSSGPTAAGDSGGAGLCGGRGLGGSSLGRRLLCACSGGDGDSGLCGGCGLDGGRSGVYCGSRGGGGSRSGACLATL